MSAAEQTPADSASTETAAAQPLLQIVHGCPTDEEVAVLTALFASLASSQSPLGGSIQPTNRWGAHVDSLRSTLSFHPGSFYNRGR